MPFLRKYNTLTVTGTTAIRVPIIKRGLVDFAIGADWTPAAGDVKILVDGTAAANVTNLPTAVATGNGAVWEFVLTAAELSCKQAHITIVDAATKAIEDQSFIVETFGNASAMYQMDLSDSVRLGLTSLPNAAAGANGGLPTGDASGRVDVGKWLGTAASTPTVAGVPNVNAKSWNDLPTVDLPLAPATAGRKLVVDTAGLADANVVKVGPTGSGTAQTARDIGLSVLLSSGTGTGQLDFTSGVVKANLVQILATALTETAGLLAGGFKKFFNVATPTLTCLGIDQTGDSYGRIGAAGAGLTALGDSRVAHLDADISSRTKPADTQAAVTTVTNLTNAPSSGDFTSTMKTSLNAATPAVTVSDKTGFSLSAAGLQAIWDALTSALTTVASIGKLLVTNIDAAISSRSTYAGGDTSGTTTLLSRIASALTISTGAVTVGTNNDKTGYALTTAYDPAKTASQAGDAMTLTAGERTTLTAVIWNALTSGMTTAGSIGKRIIDFLTGDIYARQGAPAGASISADIAAVKTDTAAIKAKTDNLPASPAAAGDSMALTVAAQAAAADKLLGRKIAGGADGGRTVTDALRALRNKTEVAAGTLTVYQEDDLATAWTAAVTTDVAADPVVGVDPA